MKTFNFIAPFTRDECLRRLRASVEPEKINWTVVINGVQVARNRPIIGGKRVLGKIGGKAIRLRKWLSSQAGSNSFSAGSNAFQTYLFGQLIDDGGQTRLRCRFAIHPIVFVIVLLWFGGVLFAALLPLWTGQRSVTVNVPTGSYIVDGWGVFVFPLLLAACGTALVVAGRYLARDEKAFLIDFLRQTLDARED
jgi:hypothetical protein